MEQSDRFVRFVCKVRPLGLAHRLAELEAIARERFLEQRFLHRARLELLSWATDGWMYTEQQMYVNEMALDAIRTRWWMEDASIVAHTHLFGLEEREHWWRICCQAPELKAQLALLQSLPVLEEALREIAVRHRSGDQVMRS